MLAYRLSLFFFQAEDGIRDYKVTGVQTCALPIYGLAAADRAHVILDGVAGHHRLAKLALVDGEKVNRARLLRAFHRLDTYHAGGLRHGLDHHHAGIYRTLRERSEEHTSELQSPCNLVCRLLLEKKKKK